MGTYTIPTRVNFENVQLFATEPLQDVKTFDFGYATPAGNEDANINRLIVGDIVYEAAPGQLKKVKLTTTLPTGCQIGVVTDIKDIDRNSYNYVGDKTLAADNGRLFTAIEGIVCAYVGNHMDYPIYANELYLHDENTTNPDARVQFDFATHALSGDVLFGRVKYVNSDSSNPQVIFQGA